jgi:hypothetical protein
MSLIVSYSQDKFVTVDCARLQMHVERLSLFISKKSA